MRYVTYAQTHASQGNASMMLWTTRAERARNERERENVFFCYFDRRNEGLITCLLDHAVLACFCWEWCLLYHCCSCCQQIHGHVASISRTRLRGWRWRSISGMGVATAVQHCRLVLLCFLLRGTRNYQEVKRKPVLPLLLLVYLPMIFRETDYVGLVSPVCL